MQKIQLFNSLTREKENFEPIKPGQVSLYTCGPTVYNYAHIGNFRTYVFEDLLRRSLKYFGYRVEQVMNLTDVDDKTIRGALAENKSLDAYTQTFKEAFFHDLAALNIEKVEHYPAATNYIASMIKLIETLMEKGVAYKGQDGSIYFSIEKYPNYGALAHLDRSELKAGASNRVDNDEYDKEHVSDFVLWKAYEEQRDGDIYWESPFGKGRPGWHIECSAMAMDILGETLDIHVGGVDNLFPHHENEIAQSECCTGHTFVKLWLHAEHLLVDGHKMAKSAGNFYTLRDLTQQGYDPIAIRYLLLQTHYRHQLNFTFEALKAASHSLERLRDVCVRLEGLSSVDTSEKYFSDLLQEVKANFEGALADDLNISMALSALFDLTREVNILCDEKRLGALQAQEALDFFKEADKVLGVIFVKEEAAPSELLLLLEKRNQARVEKNWEASDRYRDEIQAAGYVIEDSPEGSRLKKKAKV